MYVDDHGIISECISGIQERKTTNVASIYSMSVIINNMESFVRMLYYIPGHVIHNNACFEITTPREIVAGKGNEII
jgi:hypothetical protein